MADFSKEYCLKYMDNYLYDFSIEEEKEKLSNWEYMYQICEWYWFFGIMKDKKGDIFFMYSSNDFSKCVKEEDLDEFYNDYIKKKNVEKYFQNKNKKE